MLSTSYLYERLCAGQTDSRMSDPAALEANSAKFKFAEERSVDELKQTERLLDVDGGAYLRWLAGEGPDPCPPESSG